VNIAIAQWQDRVSPVFDVSDSLLLIDINEEGRKKRRAVMLTHRHPLQRALEVANLGVDVLICGAISHALERFLIGAGIEVNCFICGDIDGVIEAYRHGQLTQDRFQMPGARSKIHPQRLRRKPARMSKLLRLTTSQTDPHKVGHF